MSPWTQLAFFLPLLAVSLLAAFGAKFLGFTSLHVTLATVLFAPLGMLVGVQVAKLRPRLRKPWALEK